MRTRTVRVVAKDEDTTINVFAEIVDRDNSLTRGELNAAGTKLADAIMLAIPSLPYVGVPLSKIRAGR